MNVFTTGSGRNTNMRMEQIPSASHSGVVRLPVRRLSGVLVGRLGQTPAVLSGYAGEGSASKRRGTSAYQCFQHPAEIAARPGSARSGSKTGVGEMRSR